MINIIYLGKEYVNYKCKCTFNFWIISFNRKDLGVIFYLKIKILRKQGEVINGILNCITLSAINKGQYEKRPNKKKIRISFLERGFSIII